VDESKVVKRADAPAQTSELSASSLRTSCVQHELSKLEDLDLDVSVAKLESERPPPKPESASSSTRAIRVLLVEDDEMVRSVARRVLEQHQIRVVEAENGGIALAIFNNRPADFDVVVSDVVMPGMSGPALIELLLLTRSDLKVLYMSGYANDALVNHSVVERGFLFLQKPFAPLELVRKVRELAAAGAEAAAH
jgi:CheY-like chemotaxis protein